MSRSLGLVRVLSSAVSVVLLLGGCNHYATPGGPAPIGAATDASIAERLCLQPESPIPATLAVARIQARGYSSLSVRGTDRGGISLVGPADLEREQDEATVLQWDEVTALARLSPIIVPQHHDWMLALRQGAATLHADILAVYTVDTEFTVNNNAIAPLGLITLGIAPSRNARVASTVSLAFIDVRTGYCFGTAEGTDQDEQLANAWTDDTAVDECRRRVERTAFERMLAEAGKAWSRASATRKQQLAAVAGR